LARRRECHLNLIRHQGIEDHPLDRREGSFGYIDSFAYVYRVSGTPPSAERLVALNASALGVVTPKAVALRSEGEDVRLRLTGYGDATLAELSWAPPRLTSKGMRQHPEVVTRRFVPGTVGPLLDGGTTVLADPLLDAWIVDDGTGPRVVPVPDPGHESSRSVTSRVGEALFFTTLLHADYHTPFDNPDRIDIANRRMDLDIPAEELAQRLAAWTPPAPKYASGVFAKYAALVSSASEGAVTS